MKNAKKIKVAIWNGLLAISMVTVLHSCDNSSKTTDTKEVAEDRNDEKFDTKKSEDDAQFLVNAAEINLKEIQLGNLAAEKGGNREVKELGKMMANAHSQAMEELKTLANNKAVTIPTSLTDDNQRDYKKLVDKSGHDFDKEYCDMMVDGHKDAIDKFEKASNNSADEDIKQWASTTLPALRKHLDQALICQEHSKKM
jgi:putative membrane protein